MYAVIETGGKQLRVEVGQSIYVEKLDVQPGEEVVFNTVVLYAKYKAKDGSSHRKQGHRQPYTKLTVEAIEA